MTTQDFGEKVNAFTDENALFSADSFVVVGVSGGADSMALLHVLCARRAQGLRVHAVHVHHGLRGDEADRDARHVRRFCETLGVALTVERADVRARAVEWNCGLEEAGRRVRYAVFERVRCALGADCIATAHNADDVTETVLMHILRGCGVGGLVGIPARRGAIVRPLLGCSRAEIEAYCAAQQIPYIVDSSNTDMSFMRNRVRHELLPLLRQINPSADAALMRLCIAAQADEGYFTALAADAFTQARREDGGYSRTVFLQQPMPVRARMWKQLLADFGCYSFTERHIEALEEALVANRGTVFVSADCRVGISADCIARLESDKEQMPLLPVDALPFCFELGQKRHALRVYSREDCLSLQKVHKLFFKYAIDYDKIQGSLTVRGRCEGDYLRSAQRRVGKTLKKLFQEHRVASYRRDAYPLLCDDGGVVLVPGIGCDARVCPDAGTKHFLVWTVDDEPCYTEWYCMPADCVQTESKE